LFTRVKQFTLPLIVLVYLVAGVIHALTAPLLDVSDEPRHYAVIEHYANGGAMPVQRIGQTEDEAPWHQEGSQPPLYYALMSLVARMFDRSDFDTLWTFNPHARLGRADATHNLNQMIHREGERLAGSGLAITAIRLISLAFGAAAVIAAYHVTALMGRGGPTAPALAAALVAFNPMFLHIMASVNNDTLATAMSSLALWAAAAMITHGITHRRALALGLTLGAAALTKASGLALVITVPLFVLISAWRARTPIRDLIVPALLVAVPVAGIAGWFYIRNLLLYGDPTGTAMMAAIAGPRSVAPTAVELLNEWWGFVAAYIGLFGAVNIPIPQWMVWVFQALLALTGIGLLLELADWLRHRRYDPGALIALMCLSAMTVAFVALIRWTSMTLASQGRLLFPVVTAISALMAIGLLRLGQRLRIELRRSAAQALTAGLAALSLLAPAVYIAPAYARPAQLTEAALPNDIVRTELYFGDAIRWVGYRVDTPRQRVTPGGLLDITLYWQARQPIDRDYSAFIKLFGREGVELTGIDTYPGRGNFPTTRWLPGQIIADRYLLRLPMTASIALPTVLRLDVGFYDGASADTGRLLESRDASQQPTGRQRYEVASFGALGAYPPGFAAPRVQTADVLTMTVTRADAQSVAVNLAWRAREDVPGDYTVFMQLVDSTGALVGQADGPASNGDLAARWWRAGDIVPDTRVITPGTPLKPGVYTVRYGLYRPVEPFERMPAFTADGTPARDNALAHTFEIP
jgi:4-amino-4-deoxy-L-arabinose transferase-like glycosyltransferase